MFSTQAMQTRPHGLVPRRIQLSTQNCETHAPTAPAPATSASILLLAALVAAHQGPIQRIKVDPLLHWDLWPLARTGASHTCVARGSGGESGGGEGLTSLSASLWSVRPQLRSRVWPLGHWGYWELLTPATGHLTLLTLGLRELSLVQDPVAVVHPSTTSPE